MTLGTPPLLFSTYGCTAFRVVLLRKKKRVFLENKTKESDCLLYRPAPLSRTSRRGTKKALFTRCYCPVSEASHASICSRPKTRTTGGTLLDDIARQLRGSQPPPSAPKYIEGVRRSLAKARTVNRQEPDATRAASWTVQDPRERPRHRNYCRARKQTHHDTVQ